jgi:hypothetical protein
MHSTNITSFQEFRDKLKIVTDSIDQIVSQDDDPVLLSIQKQLHAVQEWTAKGKRPQQVDLEKLSFGMLASRVVHDTNPKLASVLYSIANFIIYWPSDIARYDYAGQ